MISLYINNTEIATGHTTQKLTGNTKNVIMSENVLIYWMFLQQKLTEYSRLAAGSGGQEKTVGNFRTLIIKDLNAEAVKIEGLAKTVESRRNSSDQKSIHDAGCSLSAITWNLTVAYLRFHKPHNLGSKRFRRCFRKIHSCPSIIAS